MTDGTCLTGHAAAFDGADNIDFADGLGGDEGLTDNELEGVETEVIIDVATVDGDNAGAAFINADSCNGSLAAAGAVLLLFLALVHYVLPP